MRRSRLSLLSRSLGVASRLVELRGASIGYGDDTVLSDVSERLHPTEGEVELEPEEFVESAEAERDLGLARAGVGGVMAAAQAEGRQAEGITRGREEERLL